MNSNSAFRSSVVIHTYCNISIFKIFKLMIVFNRKTGILSDVESRMRIFLVKRSTDKSKVCIL